MTPPIANPFVLHQRNTKAARMMGLCQNLSKMSLYDPFLVDSGGSTNLRGWFDQDLSLYDLFLDVPSRGGVSMGDDGHCHSLGLLGIIDFPNPKLGGQNRDYLLEHIHHPIRQDISLSVSAMRGDSRELKNSLFSFFKEDCNDNLASMVGMFGSVYLMAKDQMGCRLLQKKLVQGSSFLDLGYIFREVINHIIELGTDQFGNYFVQKLLQVCSDEQRTQILIMFTSKPGLLVQISLNTYGTRVAQKLIETVNTRNQISFVKSALKPGFLSLARDLNGNHVIKSCLENLDANDNQFIFEAATKFCAEIATHRHGCCVLKHCISYSVGGQRENLLAAISGNSLLLAQDPYGNYVVQYIIEQRLEEVNVMFELRGKYVELATQKFGSHVVEKCLRHYPSSRLQIVRELVSVPNFERLLLDPFANYVIQSALSVTKGFVRKRLVEKVRSYENLRMSPYCKKIFSRSFLRNM